MANRYATKTNPEATDRLIQKAVRPTTATTTLSTKPPDSLCTWNKIMLSYAYCQDKGQQGLESEEVRRSNLRG